ncbi:hypothetical protein [Arthrobacter ramosus]|uniref:Uncharacterized protein n=1 Tax=Arthrobacter ramosus TaxID=1672 RepID=A0ABV5XTE3_ARTRM|nr:hypothetical protein [Arthrobacter ramosus]
MRRRSSVRALQRTTGCSTRVRSSGARRDNPTPYQLGSAKARVFAKDSRGGTFHDDFQPRPGEIVIHEHWASSGFANTASTCSSPNTTSAFSLEAMHSAHAINGPAYAHATFTTDELLAKLSA